MFAELKFPYPCSQYVKLKNWIVHDNLCFHIFSSKPLATKFLKNHMNKIQWSAVYSNEGAIEIIENKTSDFVVMNNLFANSSAVYFIKKLLSRNGGDNDINNDGTLNECVELLHASDMWNNLSINPNGHQILCDYPEKIKWDYFCMETNDTSLLLQHKKHIDWKFLSFNEHAIDLLEKNLEKVNWTNLSLNHNAIHILKKNMDKINWGSICSNRNPNVVEIIEQQTDLDKLSWKRLSMNPVTVSFLEKHIDRIEWNYLVLNPKGVNLLRTHPEKIDWTFLCSNRSEEAVQLLEENMDKIPDYEWNCWMRLSANPYAIKLLEKHQQNIHWNELSSNSSIFEYDYHEIKFSFLNGIGRDLTEWIWHPRNMTKWGKSNWDLLDGEEYDFL